MNYVTDILIFLTPSTLLNHPFMDTMDGGFCIHIIITTYNQDTQFRKMRRVFLRVKNGRLKNTETRYLTA